MSVEWQTGVVLLIFNKGGLEGVFQLLKIHLSASLANPELAGRIEFLLWSGNTSESPPGGAGESRWGERMSRFLS